MRNRQVGKASLIFILFFAFIFAFVGFFMFGKESKYDYTKVDATIVEITPYYDIDTEKNYEVYVTYNYNGQLYEHQYLNFYSSSMYEGKNIYILVDQDNPNHITSNSNHNIFLLFGVFGIVSIAIVSLNFKKATKKSNNNYYENKTVNTYTNNNYVNDKNCDDDICNNPNIYETSSEWRKYYFKKEQLLNKYYLYNYSNSPVYSITKEKHGQYVFKDEEDLISTTYKIGFKFSIKPNIEHPEWDKIPLHLLINDEYIYDYLYRNGYSLYSQRGGYSLTIFVHGLGGNVGRIIINNNLSVEVNTTPGYVDIMSLVSFALVNGNMGKGII